MNKSSPEARIYPFRLGSETCPWVGNGKEKIKEDYVVGEDWAVGIVDRRLNLKVRFSWVTGTDEEFKEIFFDHNYELFSLGYNPETGRIEQANWTYVVEKNNKGELFKKRTRCTGFPIGSNRNRPKYMMGALPTNCPFIDGGSGSVLGLYHKRTGKFLAIGNQIAQTNLRDKSGKIIDDAPFFGPRINPNFAVLIRDEYDLAIKDAGKFDSINEFFERVR